MNPIEARKDGKGNVIVSEKSLEMLLACLDNQKFIGEAPQNGDSLAEGPEKYRATQSGMQNIIDHYNQGFRDILHQRPTVHIGAGGFGLLKRFGEGENVEWTTQDVEKIKSLFPGFNVERSLMADLVELFIYRADDSEALVRWTQKDARLINDFFGGNSNDAVNDAVNDGVNDAVNDGVNDGKNPTAGL